MSRSRTAFCACVLAGMAASTGVQGQGVVQAALASPWVELHASRVRLLGGPGAGKAANAYLAGVEITMAEGWKTYWRMPGDSGVPPSFNWAGSANVATVKVLYPAPMRLPEALGDAIGYKGAVIFPVEVVPKDASKPVELKLDLEFGVCREICIPAEAKMALALVPAQLEGSPSEPIAAALAAVPRAPASRRPNDPQLKLATASLGGPSPRLRIEARFPRGDKGADLFIEAADGLYVPLPKRLAASGTARAEADANDELVRFEVDLARGGNAGELEGKTLTLTLVSDAGATETAWVVP